MAKDKNEQATFQETEKINRKQAYEKAVTDYEDKCKRHEAQLKEFANHIVITETAIEEATSLSGSVMKLTDRVNAARIGTPLEKVEYEKAAHDVDKASALYIGRLKQVKQILQTNLEYATLNPPEAPAPFME